ncbi:unnamed protein product [Amaranthus hypochondriacus]
MAGGSWEKMEKEADLFFRIAVTEAAWEFQQGRIKGTLGLLGDDVTADIIKAEVIIPDLSWAPFALLQFILSMTQENSWVTENAKIKLSRLRLKLVEYMSQVVGIIFVIDFLVLLTTCRSATEYWYDILSKASVVKKRIPVLIDCNKTEKSAAHSKEFICKQLKKKIEVRFDVITSTRVTFYPP